MPFATECAAQLRARTVGHDQASARDLAHALPGLDRDGRYAVSASGDVDGAGTFDGCRASVESDLPDGRIELETGRSTAVVGQVAPGPGEIEELPEAGGPQAAIASAAFEPGRESQGIELGDGAGGEAVAAGLVARELLGVEEHGVQAGARRPRRGGRACWPGADDEDIRCGHRPMFPCREPVGDPRG